MDNKDYLESRQGKALHEENLKNRASFDAEQEAYKAGYIKASIEAINKEAQGDLISRESMKIDEWDIKGKTAELWIVNGKLQIRYQGTIHNTDLPSVTPIRPKSAWIDYNWSDSNGRCVWGMYCRSCNKRYPFGAEQLGRANFCPNCGADMRGEKE